MSLAVLKYLIYADLYRYHGKVTFFVLLWELVWGITTKYGIWLRITSWSAKASRIWLPLHFFSRLVLRHYTIKFGIGISYKASIGPGLHMSHPGGIHVNGQARIGRNCNLSQDVTIGMSNRGDLRGVPTIGDNVYIGPGAKLHGAIHVGNDVAIGANCVVNLDIPDKAVVFGVPARVISYGGSTGYVNRTDYDPHFAARRVKTPVSA